MARLTASGKPGRCTGQRGYALLMALLTVALVGLASLVPLQQHQIAQQRERERELLWVGEQYRQAIASYRAASPSGALAYPRNLQDLLQDPRFPQARRHLRRLYADPFTGRKQWTLIAAPGAAGSFIGVASTAAVAPLKRHGFAPWQADFETATTVADWRFVLEAAPPPPQQNPPSAPEVPSPPPAAPAPPAEPISAEARTQCLRAFSQATNACLVLPAEEAAGCRQAARTSFANCLRGGV
jgi:type II secretory pathway pseudopilin PulG